MIILIWMKVAASRYFSATYRKPAAISEKLRVSELLWIS